MFIKYRTKPKAIEINNILPLIFFIPASLRVCLKFLLHIKEYKSIGIANITTIWINTDVKISFCKIPKYPNIFFAGQISGVEGYIESISSGLVAALNMYNYIKGKNEILFDKHTIIGALCKYIAYKTGDFQPMSANMGLINYEEFKIRDKKEKNLKLAEISLLKIRELKEKENI